jgi:hypothetical protein
VDGPGCFRRVVGYGWVATVVTRVRLCLWVAKLSGLSGREIAQDDNS